MFPFNDTSLSYGERIKDLLYRLTIDEKIHMMTPHHFSVERLNIGEWYMGTETSKGFVCRTKGMQTTVFPQPMGMASMFDTDTMQRIGKVVSDKARASYNEDKTSHLVVWSLTADMERHPLCGCAEGGYGEDPCLAGNMTAAYTEGLIGNDKKYFKTLPTLQRFCGNDSEFNGNVSNANIPKRLLHEYYYKSFEPAIRFGGAESIMTARNEIDHCPAIMNTDIKYLLKDKWNLKYVVTGGSDFVQNVTANKFSETVAYALNAGVDCFNDDDDLVHNAIYLALGQRLITTEDIDRAIYNVLLCRMKLGHFDSECPYDAIDVGSVDTQEVRELSLEATRKSMTLLKNDGLLPLDTSKSVAVIGFLADTMWSADMSAHHEVTTLEAIRGEFQNVAYDNGFDIVAIRCSNGKYLSVNDDGTITATADTITVNEQFELHDWGEGWNGLYSVKLKKYLRVREDNFITVHTTNLYDRFVSKTLNFKEVFNSNAIVIEEYLHHRKLYVENDSTLRVKEYPQNKVDQNQKFVIEVVSKGSNRVAELVKQYDYSVVFCGDDPEQYAHKRWDRRTLELPSLQSEYVKSSYGNNQNTILVVVSSYPYAINWEDDNLPAILYTAHMGAELGNVVCETLTGKNNPAGRIPVTWYRSLDDIPNTMEYDIENGGLTYMYYQGDVIYPFGYGLSYSNFEYSNMECTKVFYGFKVSMSITNKSKVDGDEVVQFYYSVLNSKVSRPIKKLFDFRRVHIRAGETINIEKEYNFLDPKDSCYFEIYDLSRGIMAIEDADYNIMVASSSNNVKSTFTVHLEGEKSLTRNAMHSLKAMNYDETHGTDMRYAKTIDKYYMYALDWTGTILFKDCYLFKAERIVILASSTLTTGEITLRCDGENVATIKVAPSNSFEDFVEVTSTFETPIDGFHSIEICFTKGVSILSAKFLG